MYDMIEIEELFNFINEIVMVIDSSYKIVYLNNKCKDLLGEHSSKFIGKKCHLALFNKIDICENCQIANIDKKQFAVNVIHETINYKGLRKLYRASFEHIGINLFAEILSDITEEKKIIDQLTNQSKALKANNIILNHNKKHAEEQYYFVKKVLNSLNEGVMVVNEDFSVNVVNEKMKEYAGFKSDLRSDFKCFHFYGNEKQCLDCPYNNNTVRASRKMNNRSFTVFFNRLGGLIVESVVESTRVIALINEIKQRQFELNEKQHQMILLNDNLRLVNEKLKKAHDMINSELIQVSKIQNSLLPSSLPDNNNFDFGALYVPAEEVGGDYYDYIKIGPNHYGFLVADVSGHGIPAAVIMAITRAIIHSYAHNVFSSGNILGIVNEILNDNIHTNDFVTMFYLIMDMATGKCNFASAGHHPLLFFDKSEMMVKKINAKGRFLGIFDKVDFEENAITIDTGDIIFLYTDGLTDTMNKERKLYGFDRLITKLILYHNDRCASIIKYIMEDVKEFAGEVPFEDDITIFMIKRRS